VTNFADLTQEHFEWLAQSIRKYGGEASVVSIQSIDNLSTPQLIRRFSEAPANDYQEIVHQLQKLSSVAGHNRAVTQISRLRARFREIVEIDFFCDPMQKRVADLLAKADEPPVEHKKLTKVNRTHTTTPLEWWT
jgi:hypothetical protein